MPEGSWYEIVSGDTIQQGDLVLSCPTPMITEIPFPIDFTGDISTPVDVMDVNLIVLSQSCDIEHDNVKQVLLAEVLDWFTAKKEGGDHLKKTDYRVQLAGSNVPGYCLLEKSELSVTLDWSLVDFHRLHMLPKAYLKEFLCSIDARLRLRSPFREYLSQAFGRYFMRVGLPWEFEDFKRNG